MSRVLVAGGAGFIGSHLCDALLARGDSILCVDDLSTGSQRNIDSCASSSGFELLIGDVCDLDPTEFIGFDIVFHLASAASPPAYLARPFETLAAGSTGTRVLAEIARSSQARFVLASTSEVYGDPVVSPQTENYWGNVNPIGPRSVYDEAKRFAEAMTAAFGRYRALDTCIVRIFNTYGPRLAADDGRAVSSFCAQALSGAPLTIFGDGTQTRSFCYVDDLVAGLVAAGDARVSGPINLGNPHEITLLELASLVEEVVGVEVGRRFEALPIDDPRQRRPDISVALEQLGWAPKVDLREGLALTVDWMRSALA